MNKRYTILSYTDSFKFYFSLTIVICELKLMSVVDRGLILSSDIPLDLHEPTLLL